MYAANARSVAFADIGHRLKAIAEWAAAIDVESVPVFRGEVCGCHLR
jgi:hypothetical protein